MLEVVGLQLHSGGHRASRDQRILSQGPDPEMLKMVVPIRNGVLGPATENIKVLENIGAAWETIKNARSTAREILQSYDVELEDIDENILQTAMEKTMMMNGLSLPDELDLAGSITNRDSVRARRQLAHRIASEYARLRHPDPRDKIREEAKDILRSMDFKSKRIDEELLREAVNKSYIDAMEQGWPEDEKTLKIIGNQAFENYTRLIYPPPAGWVEPRPTASERLLARLHPKEWDLVAGEGAVRRGRVSKSNPSMGLSSSSASSSPVVDIVE